ncbi:MAG: HlyD family efflux transporter periplasmic adaptor subunit [Bacteroidales bacterium]
MKTVFLLISVLFLFGCRKKSEPALPVATEITSVWGIGKIIPEKEIIQLAMQSSGVVQEVLAADNDSLSKGAPILCLDSQTEQPDVAIANATIHTQEAVIEAKKARIKEEQAKTDYKQEEFDRIQRLFDEGAGTGQERDNAKADLLVQKATLDQVRQELKSEISKLTEAKKTLSLKEANLHKRCLTAPDSGILLELTVHPGEYVQEGATVGQFQPDSRYIATCEIDELFAHLVQTGQKALLFSSGGIDTLGTGKVIFTGRYLKKKSLFYEKAGEAEDRRVVEVKIMPDHPLPLLPNSKVECSIRIKQNP